MLAIEAFAKIIRCLGDHTRVEPSNMEKKVGNSLHYLFLFLSVACNDPVEQFIDACCNRAPRLTTPTKVLLNAYCGWCENNGHQPLAVNMFGKALSSTNFEKRTGNKFNSWIGLGLKTQAGE